MVHLVSPQQFWPSGLAALMLDIAVPSHRPAADSNACCLTPMTRIYQVFTVIRCVTAMSGPTLAGCGVASMACWAACVVWVVAGISYRQITLVSAAVAVGENFCHCMTASS